MGASVPSPPPFLSGSGEPPLPFDTWQKIFQNYMIVIQATGDAWPEARRRAVLLHCLGTEGQRLFYTLPDTGTTFEEAMTALQKHFVPKVNVVACRHTFRQRAVPELFSAKSGRDYYAIHCCFKSVSGSMCVWANGGWNAPWSVDRKCVVDCSEGQITTRGGPHSRESDYNRMSSRSCS